MKKINDKLYSELTHLERVQASIAGIVRDDASELSKLSQTCPKVNYKQNHAEYADSMDALLEIMTCIESDLKGAVIDYLIAQKADNREQKQKALQSLANLEDGRKRILKKIGLDDDTIQRFDCGRHGAVDVLLKFAPPPNGDHNNLLEQLESKIPLIGECE